MPAAAEAPECVGTFERCFSFEYEHVPVVLYRCKETGLRLALAQVQSPTVHGYFAVQTEAFDDYGCPHTLEHLIFLGSEKYPYKGVLDVLANRCLAQGTNAWTDTDHTCYTVDTAGSEGFLRILPVYLDHVLFPTLKDSGFVTEVHHITGEGSNAGVVYCEMQARENEADDRIDRAKRLAAYPGRCSYKSETGGRLKELRELTNSMVRTYHGEYYRPDNLCVIVTGQVSCRELCEAVKPTVESVVASKRLMSLPKMEQPFSSPVPKPSASYLEQIEFPAEDEATGALCEMCWHGPKWEDFETITALSVLLAYLTQDSISPLRKALVETVPPLCGQIGHTMAEQTVYLITIVLKSVDVEQLSKRNVDAEVTEVLRATCASIDLSRMQSLVRQQRRQHLASVEESPHDLYSGEIIGAFLYAPDFGPCEDSSSKVPALKARLNLPGCLESLLTWPAERWSALCAKWFLGAGDGTPRITVLGRPSKACGERIQADDANRTALQKKELGPAGCEAAAKKLQEAEAENDVDTPDELARSFKLPDVSKIRLIDVTTVTQHGDSVTALRGLEAEKIKAFLQQSHSSSSQVAPTLQFDHVAGAQFTTCHVMIPLDGLTTRELEILSLWCDVAFELPLKASSLGPAMEHEAVVQALTDATVGYSLTVGAGGGRFQAGLACNMLTASMKVERSRYAEVPQWLARILEDTVFDLERLQVAAKRMLNDVPNVKRNSQALMRIAMRAMQYRDSCTPGALTAFRVERLLTSLEEEAQLKGIAADLSSMRCKLLETPGSFLVRIAGDVLSVGKDPLAAWCKTPFVSPSSQASAPRPVLLRELYADDAIRPGAGKVAGCMVSSSAEESNYWMIQISSFSDPRSADLAPLLVAIEYLTALEGPFWRKIRGRGLSYSYSLAHNLESGTLQFGLFKSTDPIAAFQAACTIVQGLCEEGEEGNDAECQERPAKVPKISNSADGADEDGDEGDENEDEGLDEVALEAAQSGVIFGLIEPVDTVPGAMGEAFENDLQRKPPDQHHWLLKAVQDVTEESVQAALRKHILPLFTGSVGRCFSIACPAQKQPQLEADLRALQPPIKLAHFEVEDLVKTVSPGNGFANLRDRVRQVAEA
eukprot:TRINITY_DN49867_c0_g1_i1.p1 TRINITY_DN49867_c0_g1~~TRINITY_DN49867_c0_g1_i1.p1  ORF type:complete len:1112 (+),score=214.51 TRINITY_DN49867_c0_g1_i1:67-3402(+)